MDDQIARDDKCGIMLSIPLIPIGCKKNKLKTQYYCEKSVVK